MMTCSRASTWQRRSSKKDANTHTHTHANTHPNNSHVYCEYRVTHNCCGHRRLFNTSGADGLWATCITFSLCSHDKITHTDHTISESSPSHTHTRTHTHAHTHTLTHTHTHTPYLMHCEPLYHNSFAVVLSNRQCS